MKKVIVSLAILLAGFTSSLFGLEWGGLFNNETNVNTANFHDVTFKQKNDLKLYLKTPVTKNGNLRFSTEAVYSFIFDSYHSNNSTHGITNVLDFNILELNGNWAIDNNNLLLEAGRFQHIDMLGAYFLQNSDGVKLRFNSRNFNIGLYSGYTGLLNQHNVIMSKDLENQNKKQLYDLCYGYVPIMADVTLNRVGPLSLGLQASYFIDVKNSKGNVGYGSLLVSGPIAHMGSWNTSCVLGTNNFNDIMLLASAKVSLAINDNFNIIFGGEYGSGNNPDKHLAKYTGITVRPVGSMLASVSQTIVPSVTLIAPIGDNLLISLDEKFTIAEIDNKLAPYALDSMLNIVYNVFSDFRVGLNGLMTLDFSPSKQNTFSLTFNASLLF